MEKHIQIQQFKTRERGNKCEGVDETKARETMRESESKQRDKYKRSCVAENPLTRRVFVAVHPGRFDCGSDSLDVFLWPRQA